MQQKTTPPVIGPELDGFGAKAGPPASSETQLILAAKTNPQIFAQLYESHYSRILNYIYRRTLDISVAEELTSNTFFKALRSLVDFRGGSFRAWLYKIATNELRMRWRAEKHRCDQHAMRQEDLRRIYFNSRQAEQPADIAEKAQQFAWLRLAMRNLPEKYQAVLSVRYCEDLSIAEISSVLSRKSGTVKSLIHRGLRRLGKLLAADDATFSGRRHLNQSVGDGSDEQ